MAKSKKSAAAAIDALAKKLGALDQPRGCRKLLHWFIQGARSAPTPGCAECAEVEAMHAANPAPTSTPGPTPTERRRQMLDGDL
jgi:hypothetical protein